MMFRLLLIVFICIPGTVRAAQVFIYGTLRMGDRNHAQMSDAKFVKHATTTPDYHFVKITPGMNPANKSYPAMVPGGHQAVQGEVYEVNDDTLAKIDRLEYAPNFYIRETIRLADGSNAFAYILPDDPVRLDEGGVTPRDLPKVVTNNWMTFAENPNADPCHATHPY